MFQSTHPCGVRQLAIGFLVIGGGFNPRTRVGCDLGCLPKNFYRLGFNPRTRVGCDGNIATDWTPAPVSIHAPVWGATQGD